MIWRANMETLINIFRNIGGAGLDVFWLPISIWTLLALLVTAILKIRQDNISLGVHYYSRVALLGSLAAGVIGSALLHYFPVASTNQVMNAKFIVIQNPITITASGPSSVGNWSDPAIWMGILTIIMLFLTTTALLKLLIDFLSLRSFSKSLQFSSVDLMGKISGKNKRLLKNSRSSVQVIFSKNIDVPFTYGCFTKRVVLPHSFADNNEKINMALSHELIHITNGDYLINFAVQTIKALFFFHPLVHKISADIEEYREIYCDQHVLLDNDISKRNYARLLFELSPKPLFKPSLAVNMAVRPSTLKKRIQIMKTKKQSIPPLKWSLSLIMACVLIISGLMACSDIEEGGITSSEVEDVQANVDNVPTGDKPLYLINGLTVDNDILGRLNPDYIESIEVLKDKSATDAYGKKGGNGVIKITVIDRELALNNLLSEKEIKLRQEKRNNNSSIPGEEIFVAVEQNPEIIGGQEALYSGLTYPKRCREAGIEGRVIVQFVVTKQGNVRDTKILRGIGGGCDEAAVKAVESVQWKPGTHKGELKNVKFSQPITFKLAGSDKTDKSTSANLPTFQKLNNQLDELVVTGYGVSGTPETSPLQLKIPSVSGLKKNQ